jgi:hypothetical protein
MKKLSKRNEELISEGLKTQGKSMDAYFYIEERLYTKEASKIRDFIQWLIETNRPYGRANAQERWVEFVRGDKPEKEYYDFVGKFSYEVPNCTPPIGTQHGVMKKRMGEPTMEHVAMIMKGTNRELDWSFSIVKNDGTIYKELTTEEVFEATDIFEEKWKNMSKDEQTAVIGLVIELRYV